MNVAHSGLPGAPGSAELLVGSGIPCAPRAGRLGFSRLHWERNWGYLDLQLRRRLLAQLPGRPFALDLACCLLPAPDKEPKHRALKVAIKPEKRWRSGLSKRISDSGQGSLLQVYFSSAFSQKVSRKQLRGSFINVSLALSGRPVLPPPRCQQRGAREAEGSWQPQRGE